MKQEDKELLLRYLSMALPYGVKIKIRSKDIRTVRTINIEEGLVTFFETDTISPFGLQKLMKNLELLLVTSILWMRGVQEQY